jgi:hypothetical protein
VEFREIERSSSARLGQEALDAWGCLCGLCSVRSTLDAEQRLVFLGWQFQRQLGGDAGDGTEGDDTSGPEATLQRPSLAAVSDHTWTACNAPPAYPVTPPVIASLSVMDARAKSGSIMMTRVFTDFVHLG